MFVQRLENKKKLAKCVGLFLSKNISENKQPFREYLKRYLKTEPAIEFIFGNTKNEALWDTHVKVTDYALIIIGTKRYYDLSWQGFMASIFGEEYVTKLNEFKDLYYKDNIVREKEYVSFCSKMYSEDTKKIIPKETIEEK
ncbi:MAG: hypothetical protein WCX32_02605 [Clostridia bacterium]|jgi:hypothetical protein|nr:hypothetical protein [Clostridia bacterium]MDD4276189.1 hypothetical protein [Clostridia bacterium]